MTRPRPANGGCPKNLSEQVLPAGGDVDPENVSALLAAPFTTEKQELSRDAEWLTR